MSLAKFLKEFIRTRWGLKFSSREELIAWQNKRLQAFLKEMPPPKGSEIVNLSDFPIMGKKEFLENFTSLNRAGITLEKASAHALAAEASRDFSESLPAGITAGLSSGTSGTRGIFLVGEEERVQWAAVALARCLSTRSLLQVLSPWKPPLKIAFFLRANSRLYTTIKHQRIDFRYFDLLRPHATHIGELSAFAPDVLIAPATVLNRMAKDPDMRCHPHQIISVAETLEQDMRETIRKRFQISPSEIYQATEGFLGYTCPEGRIHLNEEFLHIEPEWLDAERTRFRPIITDFSRTTQYIIRHRLEDILQTEWRKCECGRHSLVISKIEGRTDEILWLPTPVYPDTIRQAIYASPVPIEDYRIEQEGPTLKIQIKNPRQDTAIKHALDKLAAQLNLNAPQVEFRPWTDPTPGEKQRRIRCTKKP